MFCIFLLMADDGTSSSPSKSCSHTNSIYDDGNIGNDGRHFYALIVTFLFYSFAFARSSSTSHHPMHTMIIINESNKTEMVLNFLNNSWCDNMAFACSILFCSVPILPSTAQTPAILCSSEPYSSTLLLMTLN